MIPTVVENWTPRPLMTAPSLVGRYVRVDPLNIHEDVPLLWDALGGNDNTLNERLKWYGMLDLKEESDLANLLTTIEETPGQCVNIFRLTSNSRGNDNDENTVAGMASYLRTRPKDGSTEVGFVAHGPAMAQRPAATEAHYLLAKHAFDTMGYRRYEWKCDSNNVPSGKAALRYGFTFEGCFRQDRITDRGTNRNTNWYSILDSEWATCKKAMELWLVETNFDGSGKQKQRLEELRNGLQE